LVGSPSDVSLPTDLLALPTAQLQFDCDCIHLAALYGVNDELRNVAEDGPQQRSKEFSD